MTLSVHLVRHGNHPLLGRILCGRMAGVQLDDQGCREIAATAEALKHLAPAIVQSSPQRRTLQSASIIAATCECSVEIASALDELDFGDWTGLEFAALEADLRWRLWNERRDAARPPNGESMAELQMRIVRHIEQLRGMEGDVILVSHAEPIRAAMMHYLGIPLREFHTIEVNPASISTIKLAESGSHVARLNGEVST